MKKQTYRAKMETVSLNNLEELVETGNKLHDQAIGDFVFRRMTKVVLSIKGIFVDVKDPVQPEGLSLTRSHQVAV